MKDLLGGSVFHLSDAILGANYPNPEAGCACCDLGNVLQNTNLKEAEAVSVLVAASSSNLSNC